MNEFDLGKIQSLLSISVSEYYGVFVRDDDNGVQAKEAVARSVLNWLEKEKNPERVERVVSHVHIYDLFLDVNENELDDIAVQAFAVL